MLQRHGAVLLIALLLLSGCAAPVGRDQASGMTMLFFGLSHADGAISEQQWQVFVDTQITPRFPDGLTVVDARGQWRSSDHMVKKEASKVLILVHEGDAATDGRIGELMREYKRQFQQEAVLRVDTAARVRFE